MPVSTSSWPVSEQPDSPGRLQPRLSDPDFIGRAHEVAEVDPAYGDRPHPPSVPGSTRRRAIAAARSPRRSRARRWAVVSTSTCPRTPRRSAGGRDFLDLGGCPGPASRVFAWPPAGWPTCYPASLTGGAAMTPSRQVTPAHERRGRVLSSLLSRLWEAANARALRSAGHHPCSGDG